MADAATLTAYRTQPISSEFERCYRRHWSRVYSWCLRYGGGNASWAEDLAHDVFLRLLEQLNDLDRLDDLGGWLYRTTANMAVSRLRRDKSWSRRFAAAWRALQGEATSSTDIIVVRREEAARALATLRRLPPRERVVVSMKLLDGHSQREIAEALDLSEGYVSKLMARGLNRIRSDGWDLEPARTTEGGKDE